MKHYSKDHEWVEITGEVAKVGISQYAAHELGDVTYVELPEMGAEFEQGDAMAVVESVKAASDVYAPVTGTVSAINEKLIDNPETVNHFPETEGWFCKLEEIDETDLDNLMTGEEYEKYVEEENEESDEQEE